MSKKSRSGVVGINEVDDMMLEKLAVDHIGGKKGWVSKAINQGFIAAFGPEQYKALRKEWIEKYLGEVTEAANDKI